MDTKILRKISYGLYVVSSKKGNRINAQTANVVMQITSEPPQIVLCINKKNLTHEFIMESGEFAVSILSQEAPLNLIGRFGFKSGRETDKFDGLSYQLVNNGCPVLLEHTLGYLEGKVTKELDVGTHTIFVAEVVEAQVFKEGEPMTYAYYHQVKRGTTPKTAPTYVDEKQQ
ncbi:MAG: flavin reductase [Deltaproteobacteria bacterium]|nr:MAG: flavin reductase [Deltaproteobacteria bacterium]